MKRLSQLLFINQSEPLKVFYDFLLFIFFFVMFWGINIYYIPKEWHLFSGWISCVIYKGMLDLQKTINELE